MKKSIILETAVQDGKVMQDFESEGFPVGAEHSQKVKAAQAGKPYGSKDCVALPSRAAVSRIIWLLLIVPCLLMGEESLQKLSWLVGEWVDTDEDVEVSMNYAFEDNNHFLINKFTMETKERDKFEGRQIITWDPAKKIIRSWIFDSDGGFGQGQWVEKGGKWMVEYTQTLPNGQIATAVHIYKKVDNNSYTFESTGRMIDGEMIPDLDPITVVRKKI